MKLKISQKLNSCQSLIGTNYYNNEIKERFLGFTRLKILDAKALFNHIQVVFNINVRLI